MRDRVAWRARLTTRLGKAWLDPPPGGLTPGALLDIELAFHLLGRLAPGESALGGYWLLSGYPLLDVLRGPVDPCGKDQQMIARHLLAPLRSRRDWTTAVQLYRAVPEHIRGFQLDDDWVPCPRPAAVLSDRFTVYDEALSKPPGLRRRATKKAVPGRYVVAVRRGRATVDVPDDLPNPVDIVDHDLDARQDRQPVAFTWSELLTTAEWMDSEEVRQGLPPGRWTERFADMTLAVRDQEGFSETRSLTVSGVFHLIGMVSSGKSTLMVLLAVCAARRRQRTVLVLGDVLSALRLVVLLRRLGLSAAPVVGGSTQAEHIRHLHRVQTVLDPRGSQLQGMEEAADLLSTACALDALRTPSEPWAYREAPCRELLKPRQSDDVDGQPKMDRFGCPLWGSCQRHRNARELVDAAIWVATPASLVHTRVPEELNPRSLRYLELAWRRADLIIVDEADMVQAQLDAIFSPGEKLIAADGESWLEQLADAKDQRLREHLKQQFGDRDVREWSTLVDTSRTLANRIYSLLPREPLAYGRSTIRNWIGRDCFTEWTLADKLARGWTGHTPDASENVTYEMLRLAFNAFVQDPRGLHGRVEGNELAKGLVALAGELVNMAEEDEALARTSQWLLRLRKDNPALLIDDEPKTDALQLEFTLIVALLSNTLDDLVRRWPGIELVLGLEQVPDRFFQRPPDDFSALVPSPPMGVVLGYQYTEPDTSGEMGDLRFFRCAGVGRWLLLHMHELFHMDSDRGPSVLLMSGTSWAGNSPRYDIQVPVHGILRPHEDDVKAIAASTFHWTPILDDRGQPIAVSGLTGKRRVDALGQMAERLSRRPRSDRPSTLERERDQLEPDRRRILLVVGSYVEAKRLAENLVGFRPDWDGQVLHLVPDSAPDGFDPAWRALGRGNVARFARTGAWLLVAPMLAIERGHNILTDAGRAAIGSAYFLIRPHPRPDDISYPVQSMNRWAIEQIELMLAGRYPRGATGLELLGRDFRSAAYTRWQHLLTYPLIRSALEDESDRMALDWTQLVTIWQAVGRLVRGGCAARAHFCDAKFAPGVAAGGRDSASGSMLLGMREALGVYLADGAAVDPIDRELAEALYGPMFRALFNMTGVGSE
jgi:hypothetical protein